MRRAAVSGLGLLLLTSGSPGGFADALDAQTLVQRLDAVYYYPQDAGLASLSCTVECPSLRATLKQRPLLSGVNWHAVFQWTPGGPGAFSITGVPSQAQAVRNELLRVFEDRRDVIVPRKAAEVLAGYTLSATEEGKFLRLSGRAALSDEPISERTYWLDPETCQLQRMLFRYREPMGATYAAEVEQHVTHDGKTFLGRLQTVYGDQRLRISLEYEQVGTVWLIKRTTDDALGPDGQPMIKPLFPLVMEYREYELTMQPPIRADERR